MRKAVEIIHSGTLAHIIHKLGASLVSATADPPRRKKHIARYLSIYSKKHSV
jgi:hypothetical protein